jgi:hypothetical protein
MEVEEKFNREMEQSRRIDLESKQDLRERQLQGRIRALEEMRALSDQKATALVALMNEREKELDTKFREELESERRRWTQKIHNLEDELMESSRPRLRSAAADDEVVHLKSVVQRLRAENDRLREELDEVQVNAPPKKPPLFGLEIEDQFGDEPGVRIASASGPSAAAGLQPQDLIHQITLSLPIRSRDDFQYAISKVEAGDRVHFVLLHDNGDKESVAVTAGVRALGKLESAMLPMSAKEADFHSWSVARSEDSRQSYVRRPIDDMSEIRSVYKVSEPPSVTRVVRELDAAEGALDGKYTGRDPLKIVGQRPPSSTSDERVKHVALDGSISYVPVSELLHRSTKEPVRPSQGVATYSPYVTTAGSELRKSTAASSHLHAEPPGLKGCYTPSPEPQAIPRSIHHNGAFAEVEEDLTCE